VKQKTQNQDVGRL